MSQESFVMLYNSNKSSLASKELFINAVISIMQSFEIIFLLDQQSVLIPSFISNQRENACDLTQDDSGRLSVPRNIGYPITSITAQDNFIVRHYILPFVPNAFFPRLISRICTSRIIHKCKSMFGAFAPWWSCWREGVCLICNDAEVLRIVPVTYPLPGTKAAYMITSSGNTMVTKLTGIEVRVAIKSSIYALPVSVYGVGKMSNQASARLDPLCAATWLLQQAIEYIDSVFDDWYVSFGRNVKFELSIIQQASPCPMCAARVQHANVLEQTEGRKYSYYLFSSQYCAYAVASKQELRCPLHGSVPISAVFPNVVRIIPFAYFFFNLDIFYRFLETLHTT